MEKSKKPNPKQKARRRKKRPSKTSEPEKILRAVQGVAGAALVAYRVIKPHLRKMKTKRRKLTQ